MPTQNTITAYAFGPFVLHLRDRVLYRMGLPVETHSKVFEILRCLVLSGDRLVTKDLLVEQVWGGSPIGDNNIAQHMHLVREVLDDLTKPFTYIETVHGRGYRFLLEPRPIIAADVHAPVDGKVLGETLAGELVSNAAFFAAMGTSAALESSLELCRKALEIRPAFINAHAAIAFTAILKAAFFYGVPRQQFDIARLHALQALETEPRCARAHIAMAALALLSDFEPEQAHAHLDAADALSPDDMMSGIVRVLVFCAQGDYAAARESAQHGLMLHGSSSVSGAYGAFAAYQAGDLEYAIELLERLLIFKPGSAFATYLLGRTRLAQGDYLRARDAFNTLLAGRVPLVPSYEKFRQRATAALAFIEARTGSADDARALARDVQRSRVPSYAALALARAGLREEDSLIACLERAREQRDPWFPFIARDPLFREYRDVPEFQAVIRGTLAGEL
jgi:DNA-binding winged helix-turn-helix (wHTH) protein